MLGLLRQLAEHRRRRFRRPKPPSFSAFRCAACSAPPSCSSARPNWPSRSRRARSRSAKRRRSRATITADPTAGSINSSNAGPRAATIPWSPSAGSGIYGTWRWRRPRRSAGRCGPTSGNGLFTPADKQRAIEELIRPYEAELARKRARMVPTDSPPFDGDDPL